MTSVAQDNVFDLWSRTLSEWNSEQGLEFQVARSYLEWNRTQQNLVHYETTKIHDVPAIVATATESGARVGIAPLSLWISLWGKVRPGEEKAFVESAIRYARLRGKTRLVFGADEFHFVSGIPMTSASGQRLIRAVNESNFKNMEVADYVGDLSSLATGEYVQSAEDMFRKRGLDWRLVETKEDQNLLSKFLAKEFPGRWLREFETWTQRSDMKRAMWKVLESSGEAIGFARMAVRGRIAGSNEGWTPGALRLPLSSDGARPRPNDSCLGPIGIATQERGKGTGKVLLGLVLRELRQNDARQVCIDWTNAFKYYEPLKYLRLRQVWTSWIEDL